MSVQAGQIRRAAHTDLPALGSLMQAASQLLHSGGGGTRPAPIRRADIDHDEIWLAQIGRGIMGFYWMAGEPECVLRLLLVAEYARGAGIGSALFGHMKVRAQIAGAGLVHVQANPSAASFFLRMGAEHSAPVSLDAGNIPDRTHFIIRITEAARASA